MTDHLPDVELSDTPLTDAVVTYWHLMERETVPADFARAQERRIAELESALLTEAHKHACATMEFAPPADPAWCPTCQQSYADCRCNDGEAVRPESVLSHPLCSKCKGHQSTHNDTRACRRCKGTGDEPVTGDSSK